jgi:hypothetical protein
VTESGRPSRPTRRSSPTRTSGESRPSSRPALPPASPSRHSSAPATYQLRGLIFCGLCQRRMQGSWNNGRPHYRCVYPTEYGLANHRPTATGSSTPGRTPIRPTPAGADGYTASNPTRPRPCTCGGCSPSGWPGTAWPASPVSARDPQVIQGGGVASARAERRRTFLWEPLRRRRRSAHDDARSPWRCGIAQLPKPEAGGAACCPRGSCLPPPALSMTPDVTRRFTRYTLRGLSVSARGPRAVRRARSIMV